MNNTYYLMRHGESQANKANLIISDPEVGCRLYGLTGKGREQARVSAEASGLGPDTIIYCSDFLRTTETAKVVHETLRCLPPTPETGLRERFFGQLEGDSGEQYRVVWARDSVDSLNTLLGAESPQHLAQRLLKTIDRLDQLHLEQTILFVSHGDTLRFLQLAVAGRALTEHMDIRLFEPAEIRRLQDLPPA